MAPEDNNGVLSVVIPCYNEKDTIFALVQKVASSPWEKKEIIVVDDCSTDGTSEVLDKHVKPLVSQVIHAPKNAGKGAALRLGFKHATGQVVIIQDADFEYDPMDYPAIVTPVFEDKADVCYGSRFASKSRYKDAYWQNVVANKFLTFLSNLLSGLKITDMETCYKAFKREIIQSVDLKEERFGIEPEITAKIAKLKCRVTEVPITYAPRNKEEGKKIGFKDGLRAIYCIIKYNLFS